MQKLTFNAESVIGEVNNFLRNYANAVFDKETLSSCLKSLKVPSDHYFICALLEAGLIQKPRPGQYRVIFMKKPLHYAKLQCIWDNWYSGYRTRMLRYAQSSIDTKADDVLSKYLTEEKAITFLKERGYVILKSM